MVYCLIGIKNTFISQDKVYDLWCYSVKEWIKPNSVGCYEAKNGEIDTKFPVSKFQPSWLISFLSVFNVDVSTELLSLIVGTTSNLKSDFVMSGNQQVRYFS